MVVDERRLSMAALTVPGLGPVMIDQARGLGLRAGRVEFDGRADVVPLDGRVRQLVDLRSAEDILILVGELTIRPSAAATAAALDPKRLSSALVHWRRLNPAARHQFRVVARVLETAFRRSALRDAMAARLATITGWRPDQGSQGGLEVWVLETRPRRYRVGLRLPGMGTRSDPPRAMELAGSLRPAVAAAMVYLAGPPAEVLVDPCCGSGTILTEATRAGWTVIGADISPGALRAARANSSGAVLRTDVRRQPFGRRTAAAVVTNLPFGHQHGIEGLPVAWYRRALSEIIRVSPRAVVLAPSNPPFQRALGRMPVDLQDRHDLTLLGHRATVWVIQAR